MLGHQWSQRKSNRFPLHGVWLFLIYLVQGLLSPLCQFVVPGTYCSCIALRCPWVAGFFFFTGVAGASLRSRSVWNRSTTQFSNWFTFLASFAFCCFSTQEIKILVASPLLPHLLFFWSLIALDNIIGAQYIWRCSMYATMDITRTSSPIFTSSKIFLDVIFTCCSFSLSPGFVSEGFLFKKVAK